jgi:hypothetical protein
VLSWRRRRRALLAAVCIASAVVRTAPARADSCTHPDLVETIPADKATGVPPNATLVARYQTNAQWVNEPVTMDQLTDASGATLSKPAPVPVTVSFDSAEGLLLAAPGAPLAGGASFVVHWPSLRGIDTATLGSKADQHFTTGTVLDTAAPTFAGLTSVSWDVSRDTDSCTNDVEERYVFNLGLGEAADDGGRDSLTLVVFETSGPGLDGSAPRPLLVQRIPPAGQGVSITSTDLVGHVCFAAIVTDLTQQASTSGPPVCADTIAPPFFYSCSVLTGRRSAGSVPLASLALLGIAAGRRRNQRRRRGDAG